MSHRERTVEQLDPMAAVNGWPLTILAAVGVTGYVVVMTAFNWYDTNYPLLAGVAILGVAAAFTLLAVTASPLQPPVSRRVHIAGLALLLGAMALSAASTAGSNQYIQDDWGPIALGLFSLFLCPYRPPRELASYAVVSSIFAVFIVLLELGSLVSPLPPLAFVVTAIAPTVALSLSGAVFAGVLLKVTVRWRNRADNAVQALAAQQQSVIARSVQQDRVTILNRDVVPLFTEALARDEVSAADRERAARIAASIRAVVVDEVDRTWLDTVVRETVGEGGAVDDPQRLATAMTTDQRTSFRALLAGLGTQAELAPGSLAIRLRHSRELVKGRLSCDFARPDPRLRAILAPYLAVIRVVFPVSDVELSPTSLTVRFEYDQH